MSDNHITLAHGDGGQLAHQVIQEIFVQAFGHQEQVKYDSAILALDKKDIAITTDSFVIKPIFFPGGDIGKLAVSGTINDLAVSGATPRYLTAGFIIEEGFLISDLKKIVHSMSLEAKKAGVKIIAGDTKVVEKGNADGIFINTTGIGTMSKHMTPDKIKDGDAVIISGTIGDHGVAILSARHELGIYTTLESDCTSLNNMIDRVLQFTNKVHFMRDPTRGGLATTLVEICEDFHLSIEINEELLPIKESVQGACDILGFEPMYLANEGKVILIVDKEEEKRVLELLHTHRKGIDATIIGRVTGKEKKGLYLKTALGSTRRIERLSGLMLPRIC